jgi:hypothetical protein
MVEPGLDVREWEIEWVQLEEAWRTHRSRPCRRRIDPGAVSLGGVAAAREGCQLVHNSLISDYSAP